MPNGHESASRPESSDAHGLSGQNAPRQQIDAGALAKLHADCSKLPVSEQLQHAYFHAKEVAGKDQSGSTDLGKFTDNMNADARKILGDDIKLSAYFDHDALKVDISQKDKPPVALGFPDTQLHFPEECER